MLSLGTSWQEKTVVDVSLSLLGHNSSGFLVQVLAVHLLVDGINQLEHVLSELGIDVVLVLSSLGRS